MHLTAALCLATITLWHPATTRMWAWPWSIGLAAFLILPATALALRTLISHQTMALPAPGWCALALGFAAVVLASALASPYRAASLGWSAPLLGGVPLFFLVHDWLHRETPASATRRVQLSTMVLLGFLPLGLESVVWWFGQLRKFGLADQLLRRNPFPLGHANYTAGIALLVLPTAIVVVGKHRGARRLLGGFATILALLMLLGSSSRGGLLALGFLVVAGIWRSALSRRSKWWLCAAGALAGAAVALVNPRTRALFSRAPADHSVVAASSVQRNAMLIAGWRMGAERPVLGWGPGTTPLAYPRFRGELEGGAENVLQLHSWPAQVFGELGLAGLVCALAGAFLVARCAGRDATAALTLGGYGIFALTDWQLDIPIFATLVAAFAASCAHPASYAPPVHSRVRHAIGAATLAALAIIVLPGRRDPAPELNARALALARDPGHREPAVSLLRASLATNADQEIAHFNLGWLLLVSDPRTAERHFRAAALLVPDKGGVYFGLGLARLNQRDAAGAAGAFALECLNDPAFLASPWWREPAIAATRDATQVAFEEALARARILAPNQGPLLARLGAAAAQLGRTGDGPERSFRRERTGYPVLMRNLNLPAPLDLFDVRELSLTPPWVAALPTKGWFPSPVLLTLLHERVPPKS